MNFRVSAGSVSNLFFPAHYEGDRVGEVQTLPQQKVGCPSTEKQKSISQPNKRIEEGTTFPLAFLGLVF